VAVKYRSILAGVCLVALSVLWLWRVSVTVAPPNPASVVPDDAAARADGSPRTNTSRLAQNPESEWQGPTYVADVNGDGRDDLIWNPVTSSLNRTYVALGKTDGTFQFLPFQDHSVKTWDYTQLATGDFNGDHRADLIWTSRTPSVTRVYVGLGGPNGKFAFLAPQDHVTAVDDYRLLVADVNGDGRDDTVWNLAFGPTNRIYVGLAKTDGAFTFLSPQDHPAEGWDNYVAAAGDMNGDGYGDLVWNEYLPDSDFIRVYAGFGGADGTLTFGEPQDFSGDVLPYDPNYEQTYTSTVADVNGDGADDLVWLGRYYEVASGSQMPRGAGDVILALGDGSGALASPKRFGSLFGNPSERFPYSQGGFADVNGDGKADAVTTVWDSYGENLVYLALWNDDGTLTSLPFEVGPQLAPSNTLRSTGDVNGDGSSDLIWNKKAGAMNRIYVGRGSASGAITFLPVQDHPANG
jgi:hypothetical protein